MIDKIAKQPPGRIIAMGFMALILIGTVLLMMPFSIKDGNTVKLLDALYTSTSAVCVTGLTVFDTADTFTALGQAIIMVLIQIGGLGVSAIGAGVIIALGKRINLKGRSLVREAMNLNSGKGVVAFVKDVFFTALVFELLGAVLSFAVFINDFSIGEAVWVSIFHSVAAFNNSGFDILGGGRSLITYQNNIFLNLVTCTMIFFGSIGFLVIREMREKRFNIKKYSLHAKVALIMSIILMAAGTVLIKLTENVTWMGAFFSSVTTRTAGFATYSYGEFTSAGLLVMMVLMFIGASSGSTGGGIKTGTAFVIANGIAAAATNKNQKAFKYTIPKDAFKKATIIAALAISVILVSTFLILIAEPQLAFEQVLFEMVSAFGTVGLSTGITSGLGTAAKIVTIVMMYIGRLGPLTVASLWCFSKGERAEYAEGNLPIG